MGIITMVIVLCLLKSLAAELPGIERSLKLLLIISTFLETGAVILVGLLCLPEEGIMLPKGADMAEVGRWNCIIAILMGLWAGLFIGLITEYYTSHSYEPVREISRSQVRTAATGIISGLALGYLSCVIPVILLAIVIV